MSAVSTEQETQNKIEDISAFSILTKWRAGEDCTTYICNKQLSSKIDEVSRLLVFSDEQDKWLEDIMGDCKDEYRNMVAEKCLDSCIKLEKSEYADTLATATAIDFVSGKSCYSQLRRAVEEKDPQWICVIVKVASILPNSMKRSWAEFIFDDDDEFRKDITKRCLLTGKIRVTSGPRISYYL